MKVVILNGPPRVGKDTAAYAITGAIHGSVIRRFSAPLKAATHAAFGLDVPYYLYEHCKDEPTSEFHGLTPRQAYIAMAEKGLKAAFGTQHFGRILADRLAREQDRIPLVVVPDSGFVEEAGPVIEAVGAENVLLIRLHRPRHTFAGDSRGHIRLPGIETRGIHNDGTADRLRSMVVDVVGTWSGIPARDPTARA